MIIVNGKNNLPKNFKNPPAFAPPALKKLVTVDITGNLARGAMTVVSVFLNLSKGASNCFVLDDILINPPLILVNAAAIGAVNVVKVLVKGASAFAELTLNASNLTLRLSKVF